MPSCQGGRACDLDIILADNWLEFAKNQHFATLHGMFHLEDVVQLKDAEDVRLVVRRHAVTMASGLLGSLALIVIPFFLLFPLFSFGIIGIILFALAVGSGIVIALRTLILWDADVFVVTTFRLVDVDQRGVFSRFVTEALLTAVQEVSWKRRGFIDTLFRVGTLTIQAQGISAPMVVSRVGRPEKIHELVNDLRHATTPKRVDLSPERRERLRKLTDLLEPLSDASLDRVEQTIREEGRDQATSAFLQADETTRS